MKILTTKMEKFSHRKILITGSSGFVGTHLTKKLTKDYEIVKYDLVNGQNILDQKLLDKKMKGVDIVVHLAAFISATESWEKPVEYFENNTLGTASVVKSAIRAGVKKIIFFSSAAVKAKPFTPYAISKINAENILNLYKNELDIVIVRPENIYGTGQKANYGYVIHSFIEAIRNTKNINIFGTGYQSRDFIYIDDVVKVVEKLIELNIKSGNVISLGTGIQTKVKDLAVLIMKIMNRKTNIVYKEKRDEPFRSVADTRHLINLKIDTKRFVLLADGINKIL